MEEGELKMKDKIFGVLQRVGRSFMLPIAILPVAGLLLGIGSSFTNATTIETYHLTGILGEGTIAHALLMIMSRVGSTVFDNLPLLFAIGVAIGMAKKEKEVAALSSVIAYLVMHTSIYALLLLHGEIAEDGQIADSKEVNQGYTRLLETVMRTKEDGAGAVREVSGYQYEKFFRCDGGGEPG